MYLISVIPTIKIPRPAPQILTYFSSQKINKGSLVLAPVRKKEIFAVVVAAESLTKQKITIKHASYELKPISKIIFETPFFDEKQIKLALWLGKYYYDSPGLFLKMMLPITKFPIFDSQLSTPRTDSINKINQKLILVPTIGQIEPTLKKYKNAVVLHSELTNKQYRKNWLKVRDGKTKIIIGTRMAVFASFQDLKEILICDETNSHHKSWDMSPHYRVHEVSQKLAELHNAKLILQSNSPSIETIYWSKQKKYSLKIMTNEKQSTTGRIIDMRQELKDKNFSIFSRLLEHEMKIIIKKGGQVILFLNRRGTSTFILCRDCGFVVRCPNCEVPMIYHLIKKINNSKESIFNPILICHHCGHKEKPPSICPKCRGTKIKMFGAGTQKVELEAQKLFPGAKISRIDSDVTPFAKEQKQIIEKFLKKEVDILISTQIIFNHLLEKPKNPFLICLITADTLLHLPDFRSSERTFQTITKLKEISSREYSLIIQTYSPNNQAIQYAAKNDLDKFYKEEIETRHMLDYPPFSQIIKLRHAHSDAKKAGNEAKILFEKLKQLIIQNLKLKDQFIFLGPSPAFIPKEKGKYIWQIIIKSKIDMEKLALRNRLLNIVPPGWKTEIDPENIL